MYVCIVYYYSSSLPTAIFVHLHTRQADSLLPYILTSDGPSTIDTGRVVPIGGAHAEAAPNFPCYSTTTCLPALLAVERASTHLQRLANPSLAQRNGRPRPSPNRHLGPSKQDAQLSRSSSTSASSYRGQGEGREERRRKRALRTTDRVTLRRAVPPQPTEHSHHYMHTSVLTFAWLARGQRVCCCLAPGE